MTDTTLSTLTTRLLLMLGDTSANRFTPTITDEAWRLALSEYSYAVPRIVVGTHTVAVPGRDQVLTPPEAAAPAVVTSLYVFDGDSLTFGTGSSGATHTYPAQTMTLIGQANLVNSGVPGAGIAELNADAAAQIDSLIGSYTENVLLVWVGANNQHTPTFTTQLTTYLQARRTAGFDRIIILTILPRDDGNGDETNRAAMNAWIAANWSTYCDGLVDVAADTRLQDPDDLTYFAADKVHLTDAGYTVVAHLAATQLLASILPFTYSPLTTGCVDFWDLEESSGSRLGSLGTTLAPVGVPARITGKHGYGVSFPTTSHLLASADDSTAFNSLPAGYSFGGWFKLTDKSGDVGLMGKTLSGLSYAYEYFLMYRLASDQFEFVQGKSAGIDECYASNAGSPSLDTWYFILCWFDGTDMHIQVNNGTANTHTATGAPALKTGAQFGLGSMFFTRTAQADAIGFWSRELASTEKTSLFNLEIRDTVTPNVCMEDFTGLLAVTQVLYPYTGGIEEDPPLQQYYYYFSDAYPTIHIGGPKVPAVGDVMQISYAATHTLQGLNDSTLTTVPTQDYELLITGAAGHAARLRTAIYSESFSNHPELKAFALDNLAQFRATLRQMRRQSSRQPLPAAGFKLDQWDGN